MLTLLWFDFREHQPRSVLASCQCKVKLGRLELPRCAVSSSLQLSQKTPLYATNLERTFTWRENTLAFSWTAELWDYPHTTAPA